jgi:hypothetical protein
MNLLAALATEAACSWHGGPRRWPWPAARDRRELTVGVRARLRVAPRAGDVALAGSVELAGSRAPTSSTC